MPDDPSGMEGAIPELSKRLQTLLSEIQSLVKQGVEHSRYEFKRSASLSRDDFDDRLDFIKLVQGVAKKVETDMIGGASRKIEFCQHCPIWDKCPLMGGRLRQNTVHNFVSGKILSRIAKGRCSPRVCRSPGLRIPDLIPTAWVAQHS